MITAQDYDTEISMIARRNEVILDIKRLDDVVCLSGEGAIKFAHNLMEAGEKALKLVGKIHEE